METGEAAKFRTRKRRSLFSEFERKRRCAATNRRLNRTGIVIGDEIDRWKTLQECLDLKIDALLAKFLLNSIKNEVITKLQEDVSYLKSEVRRLKRKFSQIEQDPEKESNKRPMTATVNADTTDEKEADKTVDLATLNSYITGNKSLTASISIIVNTLFTKEELKNCSITGKKSPKSDGCGRPALDQSKANKMFQIILDNFPGTEKKEVSMPSVRRSPRKSKTVHPSDMVKLLEHSDIKIDRDLKRKACSAAKTKSGKEGSVLLYRLCNGIFTIEEMASCRGLGIGQAKTDPSRPTLDQAKVKLLKG